MMNNWMGILLKNFNVLPRDGKVKECLDLHNAIPYFCHEMLLCVYAMGHSPTKSLVHALSYFLDLLFFTFLSINYFWYNLQELMTDFLGMPSVYSDQAATTPQYTIIHNMYVTLYA